jgi:hypothetical protein
MLEVTTTNTDAGPLAGVHVSVFGFPSSAKNAASAVATAVNEDARNFTRSVTVRLS